MNTSIAMAEAVTSDGCRVQYRIDGRANAPALLLCHAAGSNLTLWDEQMPALRERFRVVRYDSRGQGASDVPTGPYTIDRLAADALSVLDAAGIARASFCGISIGGMVGQTLATQAPVRLERLIIANSAPTGGPPEIWNARIAAVTENGMGPIVDSVLERWLTPEFRARNPAAVARVRAMLEASPPAGYAGCCAAIRDLDTRAALGRIALPTLVIVGDGDPSTPPAAGESIAALIPGARLERIAASHLSNVERPVEFTSLVLDFLTGP